MIKVKKKNKLCLNIFQSLSEFYNYTDKTPRRKTAGNSSENENNEWNGNITLNEAYKLMLNGDTNLYNEFIENKDINLEKMLGNSINKRKFVDDIVGFQPNVPNYLIGIPTNMINDIPAKISNKIINIVLCMSVSAFNSSEKIKKAGMKYAQVIDLLEKTGHRVNLYICHAGEESGEINMCLIKLKTDKQPFNLKKCVFPIAHPSMFRRIMFKWIEICDIDYEITNSRYGTMGYGSPVTNKKTILSLAEEHLKSNFILWNFQDGENSTDINKIVDNLKENYGINLGGNVK